MEDLGLGVVGAVVALDQLAVLVAHRAAVLEDGDGVLGVVVQVAGAQGVAVLVLELDHGAPELGQVIVDEVVQLLAGQHRLVLQDADVAEGLDDMDVHVPVGRVADQVRLVVEEARRSDDLPVVAALLLDQLRGLGAHQAHKAVRGLLAVRLFLGG